MKERWRLNWVLVLPLLMLSAGAYLSVSRENPAWMRMNLAKRAWREGDQKRALELYQSIYSNHPASRYADQALWEAGNIYYLHFYDVAKAMKDFQQLVERYPGSPLLRDACSRLADINEVELRDFSSALRYRRKALAKMSSTEERSAMLLRIGDDYLKLDRFNEALSSFESSLKEAPQKGEVAQKARLRIATVFQIKKNYTDSVHYFDEVLKRDECETCRLQAQLGLVEDYEFLNEIPKALEIANTISPNDYPAKDRLIRRLTEKAKYYKPSSWDGP